MPKCIKESEFDPSIHVIVSGPYTMEDCQNNCGQVGMFVEEKKQDCGCGGASSARVGENIFDNPL